MDRNGTESFILRAFIHTCRVGFLYFDGFFLRLTLGQKDIHVKINIQGKSHGYYKF